jgi:2,3-bisphosphoglycerate-independent phosphoglycerate mutase
MKANNDKVLLVILDGWGVKEPYEGNAIAKAKTPFYDRLWHSNPRAILEVSGEAVGLPEGQMGTSEVNHLTIGAGRIAYQDLVRINKAAAEGGFDTNPTFLKAFAHVKKHQSTLHIKGLLSPGGVHSHQEHIYALLKSAAKQGVRRVYLHVFTDGRDTLPKSAQKFVEELEDKIREIGVGKIASIAGRYYAMDRDHNWDRIDKAFTVLTEPGDRPFKSAREAIEAAYTKGITDEHIEPVRLEVEPGEEGCIASNDAVIFVNFRNDRPRQLTKRFLEKGPENLFYATMTQYSPEYQVQVAFLPTGIEKTLGETLATAGVKQLRITETEKFAHLTFFLNCKREEPYEGEDRIMLDSYSDIKTHDEKPEMRAGDIAQYIVQDMEAGRHQVIMTNICNGDMVGHTSNMAAAIRGIEAVDEALAKIIPAAQSHGYQVIITADHGNAEEMIDEKTGEALTQHSLNPVPFILIASKYPELKRDTGLLTDVAPTILTMLGIPVPEVMTGTSLI